MALTVLLVLALAIIGIRRRKPVDGDYMNKNVTSAVIGFFVVIIFLAHVTGRMGGTEWYDIIATSVYHSLIGQMMVVPFFFYSSYGIVKQYQKQGRKKYLSNYLIHRFLKVYLMYLVCIVIGLTLVSACTGFAVFNFNPYMFVVWKSNAWFILAILVSYLLIFISLLIFGDKKWPFFICLTVLTIGFIVGFAFLVGKDTYWYNTIIAFPLGAGFALIKDKFDLLLNTGKKKLTTFIISMVVYFGMLALTEFVDLASISIALYMLPYTIRVVSFILALLTFTMLMTFGNKLLLTLSKYSLYSYILQKYIFDIFIDPVKVLGIHRYLYFVVTLAATIVLSFAVAFFYDFAFKNTLGRIKYKEKVEPVQSS